ncbi:FAD-binding protein [Micromonospora taraxaci]|uniref:FAD-dependent oxidoreductase n=1 Tax=Micromonospora taraxaci TaxID=1316803 RepID=UPI003C2D60DF
MNSNDDPARDTTRTTEDAVARLAAQTIGPVLLPGDERYDVECASYNLAIAQRPALVVGATSAADVQAAVRFAADQGLPVAVLATGHSALPSAGALLITTRRMDTVVVDVAARTARIEAGVRWQQVVDAAAEHGLAPLSGAAPTVGVVGYTLGGGLSPIGRTFGFAADHVEAFQGHLTRLVQAIQPWSTGGRFVNLLGAGDATPDGVAAAYPPETYQRLAAIKRSYDPTNTFRVNHNIAPGGS